MNDKVKSGMYQTSSKVIRDGLRLLRERNEHLTALRRDIRAGFDAVDHGEFTDDAQSSAQQLADRVKRRGRKRLASEAQATASR